MEKDKMVLQPANLVKSEELKKVDGALTPQEDTEIKEIAKDKSEEPKEEQKAKEPKTTTKKHVVVYVGTGVWIDKTGKTWAKGHTNPDIIETANFSDEEYVDRSDIHFMVSYGMMKHTEVEF